MEAPLQTYFEALYIGDAAVSNMFGKTVIDDVFMTPDGILSQASRAHYNTMWERVRAVSSCWEWRLRPGV